MESFWKIFGDDIILTYVFEQKLKNNNVRIATVTGTMIPRLDMKIKTTSKFSIRLKKFQ